MTMPAAEMAIAFMGQSEKNVDALTQRGISGDLVAAVAQIQATCAVASGLLAIAEQLRQVRPINQEAGPTS